MRAGLGIFFFVLLAGCQMSSSNSGGTTTGNPLTPDASVSGAVAGAVGGSMSSGQSNGTITTADEKISNALEIIYGGSCPTFATGAGATCSASGSSLWLTYSGCSFPGSATTYTGAQGFFMSAGSAACGSFPNPGPNGTLYRQYVTASGSTTPSSLVRHGADGGLMAIDNHTSNLSNFDGQALATLIHGGYGASVHFDATGARDAVTLGHRINTAGVFDQTIYGNFSVAESGSNTTSRTVSGTLTVYHNALQVIGTSVFSGLIHRNTCCLPVSGTITTTFSAGQNVSPTTLGAAYVGKTETLTLTGCGTGTLQSVDGSTAEVSLSRCF